MVSRKIIHWRELPDVISTQQAADFLNISVNTVKKLCIDNEIRAKKIGAGWKIDKWELLRFLKSDKSDLGDNLSISQMSDAVTDLLTDIELLIDSLASQSDLVERLRLRVQRLAQIYEARQVEKTKRN